MTIRPDGPSICFFSRLKVRDEINYVPYYLDDLRILRELGYRVHVATRSHELRPADLYFVWWWTWGFQAVAFARLLGRPAVVTGALHAHEFVRRSLIERRLIEYSFKRATANVFISEAEMRAGTEVIDVHNPSCVPLAIDTERYTPGVERRGDPQLLTIVKMTERNGRRKCIPEMLVALREIRALIPVATLVVVGDKLDGFAAFQAVAKALGIEHAVDFRGVVSEEEKIRLLRNCAVYLQPTRFEGFGVAILEAMSCGAPVVTSPVGAVPEIVGDCAELVDGAVPNAIVRGVIRLLRDPVRRRQLGEAGRERAVSNFRYDQRKDRLATLIDEVLSGSRRSATSSRSDTSRAH